ncbi:nuclear transport factor 2 family protein [Streptomyces sp. RFCAC02]|uniref:nuclear transport factor 2 family protein n=1 Tax=Streptomyces sp. RFCAC02 TaxID=2499143 RepID=UPI001021014D|nr:nuclear transport factor 2 family protein [Streptomyces sp. RFCAC02]
MRLTRARHGIVAAFTTAALTLAAAACSSDGDDGNRPSAAGGSREQLRQAVEDNLAAINDGDVDALLASQSANCRERTTPEETAQALELIDAFYGDVSLEDLDIIEFDGTTARVRGTTGIEAIDESGDQDGARWIWEDGAWRDDSCDEDAADDQEADDPADTVPTDLPVGKSHDWSDGATTTVTGVSEIPDDSLGEFSTLTEGHTPFWVEITITNHSEQPIDLGDFHLSVEGATNGGTVDSVYIEDQEHLEGRLAPGETKEWRDSYSIDTAANGRDLVIEVWRTSEDLFLDAPTWVATIE